MYSIWFMPSTACSNASAVYGKEIQRLSTKASIPGPCFPPHVTLLGAISGFEENEMREKTESLARSFGSRVAMRMARIDKGSHFHQCVFVLVEKSDILKKYFDETCVVFGLDESSGKHYMPHLSLLYSEISQEERAALVEDSSRKMKIEDPENPLPGFESDTIELWYTPIQDKTLKSWKRIAGCSIG
eukprot:jgi/Picsp_1/2293/NSC_05757-R1_protein